MTTGERIPTHTAAYVLLESAHSRYGDRDYRWSVGANVRREVFEWGVSLSRKVISDNERIDFPSDDHFNFCGKPGLVDHEMEPNTAVLFQNGKVYGAIHGFAKDAR